MLVYFGEAEQLQWEYQVRLWGEYTYPGDQNPPGWAGARRELLDFMVQGKINKGRHTDHPAGRHSIRTNQCLPPPSPPYFLQAGCPSCLPTNSIKALKAAVMWQISDNFCGCVCAWSGGGHWLVRMQWHPAGWSVCLPLIAFPCTIKSRSSRLVSAHPGGPGKRAVKWLWWWCGVCAWN